MPVSTIWRRIASMGKKVGARRSAPGNHPAARPRVEQLEERNPLSGMGLSAALPSIPPRVLHALLSVENLPPEDRPWLLHATTLSLSFSRAPFNAIPGEAHPPGGFATVHSLFGDRSLPIDFAIGQTIAFVRAVDRVSLRALAQSLRDAPLEPGTEAMPNRPTPAPPREQPPPANTFEGNLPIPSADRSGLLDHVSSVRDGVPLSDEAFMPLRPLPGSGHLLAQPLTSLAAVTIPPGDETPREDPAPEPPSSHPLAGVLPFDARALQHGIDLFLSQFERWSLASPPPGGLSLLPWGTAVAAALAVEIGRRQMKPPAAKNPFAPDAGGLGFLWLPGWSDLACEDGQ